MRVGRKIRRDSSLSIRGVLWSHMCNYLKKCGGFTCDYYVSSLKLKVDACPFKLPRTTLFVTIFKT